MIVATAAIVVTAARVVTVIVVRARIVARVVIVIEETKPIMVSVLPKELQACVEPLIKGQTFPRTKLPKAERVTHIIKR